MTARAEALRAPAISDGPDLSRARQADDGLHLLLGRGRETIHVVVRPPTAPGPPIAQLPLDAAGLERIKALDRFWRLRQGLAAPSDPRLTPGRRRRLGQMLRALDARQDGASYREIAEALFGAARVADHPWKTSPLRDTTIRLVRDGVDLAEGGYRRLLRHRAPR